MAKRTFMVSSGFDLELKLEIDTEILTPEWAREIVHFWAGRDEVLEASEGDEYEAVARYAAPRLWDFLADYKPDYAVEKLHKEEGWCIPTASLGITILDHALPVLSPEDLEVEEVV